MSDVTEFTVTVTDIHEQARKYNINCKNGTGRIKKLEIGGSCTSVPKFYQKIDTLKLSANIKSFNLSNIYKEDIKKIECLADNPPICENTDSGFPNKVYTDAVLYVPAGCKEAYAKADIWKNFWNIYEIGSDNDGVSDILNDEINDLYNVYNIAGLLIGKSYDIEKIKNLPKGFYIITNKSKRYKIKV